MACRIALSLGAALLLAGHLLPWAAHKTSALTLSAHELAVFTNATPGAGIFLNEWYYLPLWVSAMLFAGATAVSSRRLTRVLGGGSAALVASLGLPSYPQVLTAYNHPDYRLQFFVSLAVMAMVIGAAIAGRRIQVLGRRGRAVFIIAVALISAVPLPGYLAVKPFIEQLYHDELGLGAGWWIALAGAVVVFGAGISGLMPATHMLKSLPS